LWYLYCNNNNCGISDFKMSKVRICNCKEEIKDPRLLICTRCGEELKTKTEERNIDDMPIMSGTDMEELP